MNDILKKIPKTITTIQDNDASCWLMASKNTYSIILDTADRIAIQVADADKGEWLFYSNSSTGKPKFETSPDTLIIDNTPGLFQSGSYLIATHTILYQTEFPKEGLLPPEMVLTTIPEPLPPEKEIKDLYKETQK